MHAGYYYPDETAEPQAEQEKEEEKGTAKNGRAVHLSHCIHVLLHSLMCAANTDPFVHYWVDVNEEPFPDFSIERKCQDFSAVLQWQEEKSVPMREYRGVIRKPERARVRVMSEEYKEMMGLLGEGEGRGE